MTLGRPCLLKRLDFDAGELPRSFGRYQYVSLGVHQREFEGAGKLITCFIDGAGGTNRSYADQAACGVALSLIKQRLETQRVGASSLMLPRAHAWTLDRV